jgi:hypothetical protein
MSDIPAQLHEIEILLRKREFILAHNALAALLQAWPQEQPLSRKAHQLYSQLEEARNG